MKNQEKKYFLLFIFLIMFVGIFIIDSAAADEIRINIGLSSQRSAMEVEDLVAQCGGKKVAAISGINVVTYTIPEEAFEEVKSELLRNGSATFVERDLIRTIHTPIDAVPFNAVPFNVDMIPNDPFYLNQWGPECIDAEQAWNYENLFVHPDLIVAVIDTGVDLDHPDLANQVDTGIDYDFVNNDNEAMDDNGHGTHCAGIIAAEIDNQIGIAGLQDVTIMAVKGLDENGSGWDSILAQCITYAVDNGAKVISNSWGGEGYSFTLAAATYYAFSHGAVVVAAAGNDGVSTPHYPSAYPWVIGVAALEDCNTRASWSNYGSENVFISAPGVSIYSTWWNNTYKSISGTSMACPHVAGVAAMWIGAYAPYLPLTPTQVMFLLAFTADDLGTPGNDVYYGWGRVDMFPWAD